MRAYPSRHRALLWSLLLVLGLATALPASAAGAWWQKEWPYRKEITLDASPRGGNVSQPVGRVALLIRLHTGNFTFSDAGDKGDDLRFVADDGKTPLAYHIESFDPKANLAAVWVDIPEFPVGVAKRMWLYYGNKRATPTADAAATFDPDYQVVYHFDGPAGQPPLDRSANHNNAASAPAGLDSAAVIGQGARFNGGPGVTIAASPALAIAAGGPFTFSAWVKSPARQPRAALLVRRDGSAALIVGLENNVPFVEVRGTSGVRKIQGVQPLPPGQWTHIAVTADGKSITLFEAGRPVGAAPGALPALAGVTDIGADSASPAELAGFQGEMDEVRLSKIARSPALIAVDAATQGAESRLVVFGKDEKQAGLGFGVMGLIIKNVDPMAWAIIALLAILAACSWWVMAGKVGYAGRVERANDRFLAFFHEHGGDPVALDGALEPGRFRESSIYRVYHAGAEEMMRRKRRGQALGTEGAIEVVRSLMNTSLVRENQRLSRALVVLTIAISGGPFLGLLGTVVGVMITFADVAAAGDVNINAIAPGISAALLATIAGLAVAIPALFGYNYIILRNKNISSNMLVFVDEFVARIAERHENLVPVAAG